MDFIGSFFLAFSTYSAFPVPQLKYKESYSRFVPCFFPLIGLIQGMAVYICFAFCLRLQINSTVFAILAAVLPIIITGGIHIDGYMDTTDAIKSYGDKDKKREILKDPHIGAFAVIGLCVYLLLYIAAMHFMKYEWQILMLAGGYVLSRAFSSLALLMFNTANEGMGKNFSEMAAKIPCVIFLTLYLAAVGIYLLTFAGLYALAPLFAGLLVFGYYLLYVKELFGGLSGDLAGWFLCVFELVFTAITAILGLLL